MPYFDASTPHVPGPALPAAGEDAFCLLDREGRITTANKKLAALLGIAAAELTGQKLESLLAPAPEQGESVARVLSADGDAARYVRLNKPRPAFASELQPVWLGDVTPLVLRARRQDEIFAACGIGAWQWHVLTGEVTFNESWAQMVGYTLADLSPLSIDTWVGLVHPDDLPRTNALLQQHFEKRTPYACECRMRHRDGRWVWIQATGRVTEWAPDGRPVLMCGTNIDISAQKRVFDDLQRSERSYELAAMGAGSALFDWDTASDEVIWRGRSFEIMGVTGNQDLPLKSRDFQAWVHPDDQLRYRQTLRRYFKREIRRLRDELRLLRPDGTVMWVEYRGAAQWSDAGRALRLFGSFTDISQRKACEEFLAAARQSLRCDLQALQAALAQGDRSGIDRLLAALQATVDRDPY